jgi:prepilin-type N-terminal cleavage/methylation domain-containing protein
MPLRHRAFTLVEVTLAVALMAIVGVVVFATFSSGLRLWKRQDEGSSVRAAAFFFERVQRDLENCCAFGVWSPIGNQTQYEFLAFAGSLETPQGRVSAPVRVLYAWDEAAGEVRRSAASLTDELQGVLPSGRSVLAGVERFAFAYYYAVSETGICAWSDQWPPEDVALQEGDLGPKAIRATVTIRDADRVYEAVKIFSLPFGE